MTSTFEALIIYFYGIIIYIFFIIEKLFNY